ncbi:nucleotide exchange factor GrpE [Metabacillus sp. GX 13764]|uniref:nucleotide exchange factor GrpE n=1 Tax=Metabacillus kandeliae TaxID=2900151 RepID=UPI001E4D62A9|nr:nucleotide exchange factor GrpE [Metabacillus kandeliae]MCD7033041.1 nucleotide exchange factor GrpE [Metabacillus kandeliae]
MAEENKNRDEELNEETINAAETAADDQAKDDSSDILSSEEGAAEEADAWQAENESLRQKAEEAENRLLRIQADFENFKRRSRMDLEATKKYRAQGLITELLPAIDNFERALQMEAADENVKSLLQGMEMVQRQLITALKTEGVEEIEALGKPFDPHLHQAVMQAEDAEAPANTVVEVFQKGYMLKDRVIRPAMVKVSQ